jgi:hypothetical protein
MDSQTQQRDDDAPALNLFGIAAAKVLEYGNNASSNLQDTFSRMTVHSWIRLTVIVGGYLLMRPYLMKWASKGAVQTMEDDDAKEKARLAEVTPNELRGVKEQLDEQEDEDVEADEGAASGANWGKKARVRQRVMVKQLLEAEERRRQEEEEDKDIAEYLED